MTDLNLASNWLGGWAATNLMNHLSCQVLFLLPKSSPIWGHC
jgi:hypothetical protein